MDCVRHGRLGQYITQRTESVDATGLNDRVTTFLCDFRNRQTDTNGEIDFYQKVYFDNLYRQEKVRSIKASLFDRGHGPTPKSPCVPTRLSFPTRSR